MEDYLGQRPPQRSHPGRGPRFPACRNWGSREALRRFLPSTRGPLRPRHRSQWSRTTEALRGHAEPRPASSNSRLWPLLSAALETSTNFARLATAEQSLPPVWKSEHSLPVSLRRGTRRDDVRPGQIGSDTSRGHPATPRVTTRRRSPTASRWPRSMEKEWNLKDDRAHRLSEQTATWQRGSHVHLLGQEAHSSQTRICGRLLPELPRVADL